MIHLQPPPSPNRKLYPYTGTIHLPGRLTVLVETAKGETRSGTDEDGRNWSVRMPAHYGEIKGTRGTDGDPLDVFVGPEPFAPYVYLVAIKDPATGLHDEDKAMWGFGSKADAMRCFRSTYDRNDLLLQVRKISTAEFLHWVHNHGKAGSRNTAGVEMRKARETLRGAQGTSRDQLVAWSARSK